MKLLLKERIEKIGWLSGWLLMLTFFIINLLGFVASEIAKIELPEHYIEPIEIFLYFVFFSFFLFGIKHFIRRKIDDAVLVEAINAFILVNIFEMLIFYPFGLSRVFEQDFLNLLLISSIPIFCVHGLILLNLSELLSRHVNEFSASFKRAIWWNRVTGWLLSSVILIIPGLISMAISNFFLWRFLATQIKSDK